MGIVNFSSFSPILFRTPGLSMVLAPVHALAAFFVPVQTGHTGLRYSLQASVVRPPSRQGSIKAAQAVFANRLVTRPVVRLKVMREFEPGVGGSRAGRMVISGRMADVCAELDRIALTDSLKQ